MRITIDDIFEELRLQKVSKLSDISYAVLETNGRLSILMKPSAQPPSRADMNIKAFDLGEVHMLIRDGLVDKGAMQKCGLDHAALVKMLADCGFCLADVFFCTFDKSGCILEIERRQKIKAGLFSIFHCNAHYIGRCIKSNVTQECFAKMCLLIDGAASAVQSGNYEAAKEKMDVLQEYIGSVRRTLNITGNHGEVNRLDEFFTRAMAHLKSSAIDDFTVESLCFENAALGIYKKEKICLENIF